MIDNRACAKPEKHSGYEKYRCFSIAVPINFDDIFYKRKRIIRDHISKQIKFELYKRNASLIKTKCKFTRQFNDNFKNILFCVNYITYYEAN